MLEKAKSNVKEGKQESSKVPKDVLVMSKPPVLKGKVCMCVKPRCIDDGVEGCVGHV